MKIRHLSGIALLLLALSPAVPPPAQGSCESFCGPYVSCCRVLWVTVCNCWWLELASPAASVLAESSSELGLLTANQTPAQPSCAVEPTKAESAAATAKY